MQPDIYDLKSFYASRLGRTACGILKQHVHDLWGDTSGQDILGLGYACPYLKKFTDKAERVISFSPAGLGAHHWPNNGKKNLHSLIDSARLPLENNTMDRILIIHDLEFTYDLSGCVQEIWRVLRPNGRAIFIVPNRTALWAQADWSPFGHGRPFTASQITRLLSDHQFVHEHIDQALYFPPLKWDIIRRSAGFLEKYSRYVWPLGGVHIIETVKQVYARPRPPGGSKVSVRDLIPSAEPKPALNRVRSYES